MLKPAIHADALSTHKDIEEDRMVNEEEEDLTTYKVVVITKNNIRFGRSTERIP